MKAGLNNISVTGNKKELGVTKYIFKIEPPNSTKGFT